MEDRKYVCPQPYNLQYPRLNQSIKWWFDYIIAAKKIEKTETKIIIIIMDALLDRFYEDINFSVKNKFRDHIINVTELSSSFFVLIKNLGEIF